MAANSQDRELVANALKTAYSLKFMSIEKKKIIGKLYIHLLQDKEIPDLIKSEVSLLTSKPVFSTLFFERASQYHKELSETSEEYTKLMSKNAKLSDSLNKLYSHTKALGIAKINEEIQFSKITSAISSIESHLNNVEKAEQQLLKTLEDEQAILDEDLLDEDLLDEDTLEEDTLEEDTLEEDTLEEDTLEEDTLEEDTLEEDTLDVSEFLEDSLLDDSETDELLEDTETINFDNKQINIEEAIENANRELEESIANLDESETLENNAENSEELDTEEDISYEEKKQKAYKMFRADINSGINEILISYDSLYSSAYSPIIPGGILTDSGFIECDIDAPTSESERYNENKYYNEILNDRVTLTGEMLTAAHIAEAIQDAFGDKYKYIQAPGAEPNIKDILEAEQNGKILIYPGVHLKAMYGALNFCLGRKTGLRAYLHSINNTEFDTKTKITNWKLVRAWLRDFYLKDIFLKAIVDMNLQEAKLSRAGDNTSVMLSKIKRALVNSLKQIVISSEYKENINTKIRICTNDPNLNTSTLVPVLAKKLNTGTSSNIQIKQVGSPKNGVLEINIIENEKAYSQSDLFAHQVLPELQKQKIIPSWSNILLGQDANGLYTRAFTADTDVVLDVYAGTGSGKGVMTLNLICAALADGAELMYVDGKPDSAIALTKAAWSRGTDVAVINGVETKGKLINMTGCECPRTVKDIDYQDNIPDGIFVGNDKQTAADCKREFILITEYLKAFEFYIKYCEYRNANPDKAQRRLVVIFDELQQVSEVEQNIVSQMEAAANKIKHEKEEVDGKVKTKNYMADKRYQFIENYMTWRDNLKVQAIKAIKSTLRPANTTGIYIWQSSKFPSSHASTGILGAFLSAAEPVSTKCIGFGGAQLGGSQVFGTPASLGDKEWYSIVNQPGLGYWAIGTNVQDDSTMHVFKPYKVFSTAANKKLLIDNARKNGLTEDDLVGSSLNQDGTVIQETGFEAYASKLLELAGLDFATQLSTGINAFDSFAVDTGLGQGFLDAVYHIDFSDSSKVDAKATEDGKPLSENKGITNQDPTQPFDFTANNERVVEQNQYRENSDVQEYEQEEQEEQERYKQENTNQSFTNESINQALTKKASIINQPMSCKNFTTLDAESQQANINRVIVEMSKQFSITNRQKKPFGLIHLCWNISILYYTKKLDTNLLPSEMQAFASNYANNLANGHFKLDYIPTEDEVRGLMIFASTLIDSQGNMSENKKFNNFEEEQNNNENEEVEQHKNIFQNMFNKFNKQEEQISPEEYENNPDYVEVPQMSAEEIRGQQSKEAYERAYNEHAKFEDLKRNIKPAFSIGDNGRNNIDLNALKIKPILLDNKNSVNVKPAWYTNLWSNMISKSDTGVSYLFSNRTNCVIDSILASIQDKKAVTRIVIQDFVLIVNNRLVDTDSLIDDTQGIRFEDFVNVKKILSVFKNVQKLSLDYIMYKQLIRDYGADVQSMWKIFQENLHLEQLELQLSPGTPYETITRENYTSHLQELQNTAQITQMKEAIEQRAASINPRIDEKGIGYQRENSISQRWINGTTRFAKGSKEAGKIGKDLLITNNQENFHPIRGAVYGLGAGIGLLGSGALSLVPRIIRGFKYGVNIFEN